MGVECPKCGEEYERLGQHWGGSPDHRPELTQHQKEIITGLLMGDGWIDRFGEAPRIKCEMISPNHLKFLDDRFGCLSTGVNLVMTAEESAQHNRDSGFRPNAKVENYSDKYIWRSRRLPELQQYADWYSSGKKVWPEDIALTPTVLKHWYCGDGTWVNSGHSNYISIALSNEVENTDKVDSYFERGGLPTANNYNICKRDSGHIGCTALWTVEDSKELWNYMGEPLPDFEYKWPEMFHNS